LNGRFHLGSITCKVTGAAHLPMVCCISTLERQVPEALMAAPDPDFPRARKAIEKDVV